MASNLKKKSDFFFRAMFCLIVLIYGGFIAYASQTVPQLQAVPQVQVQKNSVVDASPSQKNVIKAFFNNTDPSFEEFYLSQITSFYQQIITLLSVIIGIILIISFLYLHFTSRMKAEEMAHNALEAKSFQIILGTSIDKKFVELKNEGGDISDLYEKVRDLEERAAFLEKQLNEKSYTLSVDEKGGKDSGNS